MANVKVKVKNAVVGGLKHDEEGYIDENTAKMLEERGYVEILDKEEKETAQKEPKSSKKKDEK